MESHNSHSNAISISVKLSQRLISAFAWWHGTKKLPTGGWFCTVRRRAPRGRDGVIVLRITLCIVCCWVVAHNHQGYLWSPTFQDVLYERPAGFVYRALWVFLPCCPQEASMVQNNGFWFSWEHTPPETRVSIFVKRSRTQQHHKSTRWKEG